MKIFTFHERIVKSYVDYKLFANAKRYMLLRRLDVGCCRPSLHLQQNTVSSIKITASRLLATALISELYECASAY